MVLRLTGARAVGVPRETVWDALHDARCLKLCVPGCLSLERVADTQFALSVLVPIGPVSLPFHGTIEISDSDKPSRLVLQGRGNGGLAGLAVGALRVALEEMPGGTRLVYVVEAEASGPFAIFGNVLLAGLARDLAERFGATLASHLDASHAPHEQAQPNRSDSLSSSAISTGV